MKAKLPPDWPLVVFIILAIAACVVAVIVDVGRKNWFSLGAIVIWTVIMVTLDIDLLHRNRLLRRRQRPKVP